MKWCKWRLLGNVCSFVCFFSVMIQLGVPPVGGVGGWIETGMAEAITLDEAIKKALSDSDRIREIQAQQLKSEAEARQVDGFTATRLDTTLSYTEMGSSADDNPYFPIPDRDTAIGFSVSRPLWAGGRIPVSHALKESLMTLAVLAERTMTRNLIRELAIAFHTVLYEEARLDVMTDRVAQREDELESARDLFDAGMVTNLDVREARLNLHMIQDELRAGENDLHTALVNFNLLLGIDTGAGSALELERPNGKLARAEMLAGQFAQLEAQWRNGEQLDLLSADAAVGVSDQKLGMAKGARLPEITWVAGAEYGGDSPSGYDVSWRIGAQLNWNLFDGGTKQAAVDASLAEKKSRVAVRAQLRKDLFGAINKLKSEAKSLDRRIALQIESVRLAEGNYEDARGMYGTGTMTMTRLGDFNLFYAEARFNLLRLHYLENLIAMEVEALLHQ